jgi:hypothetical protein
VWKDLYHRYNEAQAKRVTLSPNPELLFGIRGQLREKIDVVASWCV